MERKVRPVKRRRPASKPRRVAEQAAFRWATPLLLDSHAFLWFVTGSERLSPGARRAIENPAATVYVSAASIWEIAIKRRLGKLPSAARLQSGLPAYLRSHDFTELPITAAHAEGAAELPPHHRDPFDRMLVAQARIENLRLVSNDVLFDAYGILRFW